MAANRIARYFHPHDPAIALVRWARESGRLGRLKEYARALQGELGLSFSSLNWDADQVRALREAVEGEMLEHQLDDCPEDPGVRPR